MSTFGYTATGGTSITNGANFLQGNKYALSEAGDVTKISILLQQSSANNDPLRAAIYSDNAGVPGTLLGVTAEVVVANVASPTWVDFAFSPAVSLTAATYWLMYWAGSPAQTTGYYDATATMSYESVTYSSTGNPPSPYTQSGTVSRQLSMYATYTPTAASPPANTVAPAVTGTAQVGSALSTTNGTWTDNGSPTFTYQWQRDNTGGGVYSNIVSATASSYTLVDADDGCHIRCVVTDTDTNGSTAANSNSVGAVTEPVATNTAAPVASGTAQVNSTVSAGTGTWTHMGGTVATYAYQWQDSADNVTFANITGATLASYAIPSGELAKYLRCNVTATNTGGTSAAASSNSVGPVAAKAAVAAGNPVPAIHYLVNFLKS